MYKIYSTQSITDSLKLRNQYTLQHSLTFGFPDTCCIIFLINIYDILPTIS